MQINGHEVDYTLGFALAEALEHAHDQEFVHHHDAQGSHAGLPEAPKSASGGNNSESTKISEDRSNNKVKLKVC